tara:strand:- start:870 stop:1262 length:393 start_codon:yes stop_codon:yes gene_type:complete
MSEIYILIDGGTKKQRQLIEDVTSWFVNKELPRYKNLNIEIDLEKIDDAEGYCLEVDKREFHIQIDKRLKGDDFVTCLFHELTHVEQYLRNKFGIKDVKDNTNYLYEEYEIDAYIKQEKLLKEWKNATIN